MEPLGAARSHSWCPTLDFPPWSYLGVVLKKGQDTSWWLPCGFWTPHPNSLTYFCSEVPSWVSHPGFCTLEPSGSSSQEGTGHILVIPYGFWTPHPNSLPHFCLDVPSLVPHPGFPILDVPSWSHLAEVFRKGWDTS